jgi:signal peptidase
MLAHRDLDPRSAGGTAVEDGYGSRGPGTVDDAVDNVGLLHLTAAPVVDLSLAHEVPAGCPAAQGPRAAPAPARRRARKVVLLAQAAFLTVLALFAALLLLVDAGPHFFPFQTMVVESGSMTPTLPVGSVAIYRHETAAQVKVGQIILFSAPSDPSVFVSHRVHAIVDGPNGKYFSTKGDANPTPDTWRIAAAGSGWYVVGDIPLVGYALRALQMPTYKLLLIIVPAALIGLLTVRDIAVNRYRRRKAEHRADALTTGPS